MKTYEQGRADALAELHPHWLAEKERADRAEARIAELEAQIAAKPADTDKMREVILALPNPETTLTANVAGYNVPAYGSQHMQDLRNAAADLTASTALQAPVREVPRWQPIETAPKDGTHILLWWGEQARLGWWLDNSHTRTPWAGWKVPSLQVVPFGCQPTHWMPLPAAPVQQEGE